MLVSNEQLVMRTPAMETPTSIASNNENDQEVEASETTHSPDLTINCLTGIIDTSPKCKVISIDGMAIVNAIRKAEIIKTCNGFAQVFLDQLSTMASDYANNAHSTSTLRSNDLEKGRGKPSEPSSSGQLWLGV